MCPSLHWRKEGPHGLVCAIDLKGGKRQDISPALSLLLLLFLWIGIFGISGKNEEMWSGKREGEWERRLALFPRVLVFDTSTEESVKQSSFIPRGSSVCVCAHVFVCESCLLFLALDLDVNPKCAGLWIWAIPPPDWEFLMLWHLSLQHWGKVTFCNFSYFRIFPPLYQLDAFEGYEPFPSSSFLSYNCSQENIGKTF